MWRGWTAPEDADAFQSFLLDEFFPSRRGIPGFLGADILRDDASHDGGDEVAFVVLTRFNSLEDIQSFTRGGDPDAAVIEPKAAGMLRRYDERAPHYKTAVFHR
jgi:heme-degrading monooxygenase HmoA